MIIFVPKKIISVLLAVFVLLGITGIAFEPGKAYAATASPAVGVVNYGLLIERHPDTPKANEALKTENEQAKKEFDAKAAGLGDKEKQDLSIQLTQRVDQKRQELLKGVTEKINAAVKEVADAKGLTIVVDKGSVVYGGQDITDEVLKKIGGK
ncbi:MAG TPA: OmpH family outer membrane protein [Methylomusa anaerophila]|uniref:Periplasmic chaperone n=1 Tax=Methylomusa anaerophila TaxID=1930071 RepID=A0A348AMA1_9FIRM|nr:OmpH family outer membrane protein [Methylomusa anaerophila]BBB92199.1 periplasmic chaperone [Methylomusa anaerophila]HML87787.1 OmpH family outer membrane protein [Methylomusa anaerophila]